MALMAVVGCDETEPLVLSDRGLPVAPANDVPCGTAEASMAETRAALRETGRRTCGESASFPGVHFVGAGPARGPCITREAWACGGPVRPAALRLGGRGWEDLAGRKAIALRLAEEQEQALRMRPAAAVRPEDFHPPYARHVPDSSVRVTLWAARRSHHPRPPTYDEVEILVEGGGVRPRRKLRTVVGDLPRQRYPSFGTRR
ncbi:MAG TPA: hypothetical protein RMF84_18075 [Polyangiaceae bacterium LLY-WYZ-14_1]|nr:hypothetical protein [Polyangiaceae bacterium LLY-WYZ-14_1]